MKTALIFGITGQDGSYLAELLLSYGYSVHGVKRRSSSLNTSRIDHIFDHPRLKLHYGDVTDALSVTALMQSIRPDEVYNLAAQSHVQVSFDMPAYTAQVDAIGTLNVLEAARLLDCRVYQASTSELFGGQTTDMLNEDSPMLPRSPYAAAKLYAYHMVRMYREAYGMHASNGILFNHESPRRGETFVTRKVCQGVARWMQTKQPFTLGNVDAVRDWGHAKDYVRAMWLMLQVDRGGDYVVATGKAVTVRRWVEMCVNAVGWAVQWDDSGALVDGTRLLRFDARHLRPLEVDHLLGDASRIRSLGWEPRYTLESMCGEMMAAEMGVGNNKAYRLT